MRFIDLDVLDKRIKQIHRPTPYQVLEIIAEMHRELEAEVVV